jgi:tetratricopeptide (TPR) repeat protein
LNLGVYEQLHHRYPAAIDWYRKATEIARNPRTQARAFNNLGYAYKATGDLSKARENLQKAVQIDPEYVGAWISLGVVAQKTGDLPLAVEAYSHAEQIHPTDYGYLLLAGALDASGQKQKAVAAREKAELLSKDVLDAQRNADDILRR